MLDYAWMRVLNGTKSSAESWDCGAFFFLFCGCVFVFGLWFVWLMNRK
jgi:hypothetical protein